MNAIHTINEQLGHLGSSKGHSGSRWGSCRIIGGLIISFVVNCDLQSNQVQHASHEFPPSHVPMVIPVPPLGVKVILADSELDDKSVSIRSI